MKPTLSIKPQGMRIPEAHYKSHLAYGKLFGKPKIPNRIKAMGRFAPQIIWHARILLLSLLRKQLQRIKNRPTNVPAGISELVSNLHREGAQSFSVAENHIQNLNHQLAPWKQKLQEQRRNVAPENRGLLDNLIGVTDCENICETVRQLLNQQRIFDVAYHYLGYGVQIVGINLQISYPDDLFWRNHFSDVGLPSPRTAYMHLDSSIGWLKCLIYLSHVNEQNGPFCYVVGSHQIRINFLEYLIRKSNDTSRLDKWDRETRELFWSLPSFFQKKLEFGNDLEDTSSDTALLLDREKRFTSQDGNLIFFDNDGIHRGGMVQEGHREILQIILASNLRSRIRAAYS